MSKALVDLLLALGDDELILGHRHSEWTGWAPHIEEDVAFSSIAQDEIGHAAAYYALAGKVEGRSPDEIAFGRKVADYRNALLCERPNGDWAYTLARHWLYDHADDLRLEGLEASTHKELASLATKIRREERYHLLHADTWMARIAHGPLEGRTKLIHAVTDAFGDTPGLFEPIEMEDKALEEGLMPITSWDLKQRYNDRISSALEDLGLPSVTAREVDATAEFVASSSGDLIESDDTGAGDGDGRDTLGGRRGRHTADLDEIWDVMTRHYRDEPGATW